MNNGLFDRCKKNIIVYNKLKAFAFYFKRPVNCDAAYHSIVIDKEGDIYACHRFVGMKQFVLGNIEEQTSLKEVFVNSPLPDKDKKNCCCKQCWAYNLCSGGCFYDNYMLTGSCVLPDEKRCDVYKTIHLEVLKLFVGLTAYEKTQLCLKK